MSMHWSRNSTHTAFHSKSQALSLAATSKFSGGQPNSPARSARHVDKADRTAARPGSLRSRRLASTSTCSMRGELCQEGYFFSSGTGHEQWQTHTVLSCAWKSESSLGVTSTQRNPERCRVHGVCCDLKQAICCNMLLAENTVWTDEFKHCVVFNMPEKVRLPVLSRGNKPTSCARDHGVGGKNQ